MKQQAGALNGLVASASHEHFQPRNTTVTVKLVSYLQDEMFNLFQT